MTEHWEDIESTFTMTDPTISEDDWSMAWHVKATKGDEANGSFEIVMFGSDVIDGDVRDSAEEWAAANPVTNCDESEDLCDFFFDGYGVAIRFSSFEGNDEVVADGTFCLI